MITAQELRLSSGPLELAARAFGPPDGRRVLMLHGWLDNACSFDELGPRLANMRCVALDLAGHGLSQHRSADAQYHLVDAVADVRAAVRALEWTRFCLVGHSLGAAIASLYAGAFAETVERLVLLEGIGPLTEPESGAVSRLRRALDEDALERHTQTRVFADHETAAKRVLEAAPMKMSSALTLLSRGLKPVPGGFSWRTDPRLRGTSRLRLTEAHVEAFLRAVQAPTLLLMADRGFPIPADVLATRAGCVPQLERLTLPGGHHLHLDHPEPVAAAVAAFLRPPAAA